MSEPQKFDPTGRIIESGKEVVEPLAGIPTRKKARFELFEETSQGFKWEIEVVFDPRTYPYKILGGKIVGTICGSPNWEITEGEFGAGLRIKAQNTQPTPGCSEYVVILGAAVHPSSYTGVYDFSFNGSAYGFKHDTIFLGFSEP